MHVLRNSQMSTDFRLVLNNRSVIMSAETGMVIAEGNIVLVEGSFSMVCIGENPSGFMR